MGKKLVIRKIARELQEIQAELGRLAADKSPTKDGAQALFDAYKKKHPGTKKTPGDFFDPKAGERKKSVPAKKRVEIKQKLVDVEKKMKPEDDFREAIASPATMKKLFDEIKRKVYIPSVEISGISGLDTKKKSPPTAGEYDKVRKAIRAAMISQVEEQIDYLSLKNDTLKKEIKGLEDKFAEGLKGMVGDLSKDDDIGGQSNAVLEKYMERLDRVTSLKGGDSVFRPINLLKAQMGNSEDVEKIVDEILGKKEFGGTKGDSVLYEVMEDNFDWFKKGWYKESK